MKTRIVLSVVFLAMSAIAAMLPQKRNRYVELNAAELLTELQRQEYYITPDALADLLIQQDPSVRLIDLRSPAEFAAYSLPGAVNIPLDSLLTDNWLGYVDQDVKQNIFFSNGSTLSTEGWMLVRQMGFRHNYVLQGGLNAWFTTIVHPRPPRSTAPAEDWARYRQRLGASQFFTGKGAEAPANTGSAPAPIPRRQKKAVKGGCS